VYRNSKNCKIVCCCIAVVERCKPWLNYVVYDVDEGYSESDLVCLTNNGKLLVFSLPHLRRQLSTNAVVSVDDARLLLCMIK